MPQTCSVPTCKGNYRTGPKVKVFCFPKEKPLLSKWLKAIERGCFKPTKNSKVCELHFKDSDFETELSAFDPKTGRTLTAPLSVKRLKKNAIPSLNINLPMKSKSVSCRETPEQRRKRLEMDQVSQAVQDSLKNVRDENSLTENISETSFSPNTSVSRQTENSMETDRNKGFKRKRKLEKDENVQKTDNGPSNASFASQSSSQNAIPYCNDSNNFSFSLQDVEIKEETPWEEEYGYTANSSSNSDRVKILSVQSHASSENVTPFSSQQSIVSTANSNSNNEKEEISPQKESNSNQGCDSAFYKKPVKIYKKDEAFGRFVACEMSDLRVNPELYLKTQRSILKLLVEAHFEQISASNVT